MTYKTLQEKKSITEFTGLYETKYICVFLFHNLCFGDSKGIKGRCRKEKHAKE
jgi:hypothetical protein